MIAVGLRRSRMMDWIKQLPLMQRFGRAIDGFRDAQSALRASEAALNEAQAIARLGSWTLNVATDALTCSAETYRIFGLAPSAPVALDAIVAQVHPDDREFVIRSWNAALRGQPYDIEHRICVGNEVRWVRECAQFRYDAAGTACSAVGTVQDITELKRMQSALKELNRDLEARVAQRTAQLEAANRAKSDFLANMSHEIRTPMNTILGMAYLALKGQLAPRQRDHVEKIYGAGRHLLDLIDAVLDFSKIEAGKLTVECIDFDLADVVAKVEGVVAGRAAAKGLGFAVHIDPRLARPLRGDPLRLRQVLINYVTNAVKFTERGGIAIRAELVEEGADGFLARFAVEDSGIGIGEQEAGKLFQSFTQADHSIGRKYGGTGLGLAICKQLALLMGGAVGFDSTPGRGSTFWFTARLGWGGTSAGTGWRAAVEGGAGHGRGDMLAPARLTIKNRRILVADDHPLNQEVARELLEDAGATVCVANNGAEAIELLRQTRFDCVLMDVQMPGIDGLEATRRIRRSAELALTPIVAMTANAWNQDRTQCLDAGMNDFISKPIDARVFYTVVARWVAHGRTAAPGDAGVSAGGGAAIDLSVLAQSLDGDAAKMRCVALKFVEATRRDLSRLAEASASGDLDALRALGHRIKAPARAVGAAGFADLCLALEDIDDDGADRARDIVGRLPPLFEQIAGAIERDPRLACGTR